MAAGTVIIYSLNDPDTKECRYVGKANDLVSRIRCHKWEANSSLLHNHKVNWLRTLFNEPIVEVLQEVCGDNWQDIERWWINELRQCGHNLTNFADGGQTSPVEGKGHTAETKTNYAFVLLKEDINRHHVKGKYRGIKELGE